MKTFTILAAPLALLSATPALAQAMSPSEYVMTAGASDLYEKTSSQVVLQTTTNPDVKMFAQEMIRDHTQSTAMVKAAAMKSRVKVSPPMLTAGAGRAGRAAQGRERPGARRGLHRAAEGITSEGAGGAAGLRQRRHRARAARRGGQDRAGGARTHHDADEDVSAAGGNRPQQDEAGCAGRSRTPSSRPRRPASRRADDGRSS